MAICNARYQFTIVDIGDSRKQSDGGVYANSNLFYFFFLSTLFSLGFIT